MAAQKLQPDPAEIRRALTLLHEPGDVFEIRAFGGSLRRTLSGYFDDYEKAARAADDAATRGAEGVYVTLNPVNPALRARAYNRLVELHKGGGTADKDIVRRRWLLIDIDPERPSGISSTDLEHEAALDKARECRVFLSSLGWPAPILADSGNGAHLLYAIDLPADDGGLVSRILTALNKLSGSPAGKVDRTTFNPARIVKLYGTPARKGDSTPERPHRLSRIIEFDDQRAVVSRDMLLAIAARAEMETGREAAPARASAFDARGFLSRHGIEIAEERAYQGGALIELRQCPFGEHRKAGKSAVFIGSDGSLGFHCLSDDHANLHWRDLREKLEPERARASQRNDGRDGAANNGRAAQPGAGDSAAPKADSRGHLGVLAEAVEREDVAWLWRGRIARGAITTLDGDPDVGKSLVTIDLAARISRGGKWPDGSPCGVGVALIVSAEDNWANTVRPRLEAAGADLGKVYLLPPMFKPEPDKDRVLLTLPDHFPILERAIEETGAVLVVIDPLNAFLAGSIDTHKDHHVRRALAPLADVAERTGAAAVIVRHLNKSGSTKALYRGGGSIAYTAAARFGYVVVRDADDRELRHLANVKSNLASPPKMLDYRIEVDGLGMPFVDWQGTSEMSADEVLAQADDAESPDRIAAAVTFLRDELMDGPVTSKQVQSDARSERVSERTLYRAKKILGVRSEKFTDPKTGKVSGWMWRLPGDPDGGRLPLGNVD